MSAAPSYDYVTRARKAMLTQLCLLSIMCIPIMTRNSDFADFRENTYVIICASPLEYVQTFAVKIACSIYQCTAH